MPRVSVPLFSAQGYVIRNIKPEQAATLAATPGFEYVDGNLTKISKTKSAATGCAIFSAAVIGQRKFLVGGLNRTETQPEVIR